MSESLPLPSVGFPVAYTPNPAFGFGSSPVPALTAAANADGTLDLVILPPNSPTVFFESVPAGPGEHTWQIPPGLTPA
jgi:hypothetical protein